MVALGTPVFVLLVVESIILRSWLPAAFAAYVGVGLGIAAFIRIVVARRRGRATRNKITRLIATPSRWGSLDRALASYNIRTGLDGPTAAVCSQNRDGTRVTRVDAELVYMGPPDPASGVRPFRSPLRCKPGTLWSWCSTSRCSAATTRRSSSQ